MAYLMAFIFFFIISAVVIFDIWIVYKAFSYGLKLIRYFTEVSDETYHERLQKQSKFRRFVLKYPMQSIVAFVLLINTTLLIDGIRTYYNENMRHPEAKALYVVGNIANIYSKALSVYVGAPDMWYLSPLHMPFLWIKEKMFALGDPYIDYNSAERALWKYDWFYHPYIVKFYQHRGFFDRKERQYSNLWGNETFRAMLEDLWKTMEIMNTQPFEDKNRYYDFLMVMPTMGTYYFLYDDELLSENESKRKSVYLSTNPLIVQRHIRLHEMMNELYTKWDNPDFIKGRLEKAPQVDAMRDALMLMLMEQRISELIYTRDFSCTYPMIVEYTQLRQAFFSTKNPAFILLTRAGKEQRVRDFIDGAKDNSRAEYARQLLWEYCGIDLPGVSKYYPPVEGDEGWHYGLATKTRLFAKEIRILENELNITRINESKPTVSKEDIKNSRSKK